MTIYSQTESKRSNQTQAIQHFIEKMDIEIIDAFLDNDKTYQDFEKKLPISISWYLSVLIIKMRLVLIYTKTKVFKLSINQ